MLKSMTGFARRVAETPLGTLTCEIRSVNHRYLDAQFRLPEELRPHEVELRQVISQSVKRGKVECSVHIRRAAAEQGQLNKELVGTLSDRIEQLNELLPATRGVDPIDVLRWPGVIEEPELESDSLLEPAQAIVNETLASLTEMRQSEGARIAEMLLTRCDDIMKIADSVRERMPCQPRSPEARVEVIRFEVLLMVCRSSWWSAAICASACIDGGDCRAFKSLQVLAPGSWPRYSFRSK